MAETETTSSDNGSLTDRVKSLRLTESAESDGNAWWWLPWSLCGVLLCVSAGLALEAFSPIDDEMIKKLAADRGLDVDKQSSNSEALAKLGLGNSVGPKTEIALEGKGYIVPFSLIQVSPKVGGTVMKLYIREGMPVEKNDVLAELEEIEYKAEFDGHGSAKKAAQARLDKLTKYRPEEIRQIKSELDEARYQLDPMEKEFQRSIVMKQRGALAPKDYESAESSFRSMKARVEKLQLAYDLMLKGPRDAEIDAMRAEFKKAESDLVKAKWRYENTQVRAPIKGIILSKKTEEGNIVNPSAFSNGLSASLCEMADLHNLEVDLSIAERDIGKLFAGQDCRIRAEAFPERIYPGYVSRIMPMADRAKSAVPVRVKINFPAVDMKGKPLDKDTQGEFLRPEMGAIVTFLSGRSEKWAAAEKKETTEERK